MNGKERDILVTLVEQVGRIDERTMAIPAISKKLDKVCEETIKNTHFRINFGRWSKIIIASVFGSGGIFLIIRAIKEFILK